MRFRYSFLSRDIGFGGYLCIRLCALLLLLGERTLAAPRILQQPVSRIIPEGNLLWFSIELDRSEDVQFQWRKSGRDIDGAQASSLFVGPASVADEGDYQVIVRYPGGELESEVAEVIVQTDDKRPNRSFYPLLNVSGAWGEWEIDSYHGSRHHFTSVLRLENTSIAEEPRLIRPGHVGNIVVIGVQKNLWADTSIGGVNLEDISLSSVDYEKTEEGINYYGLRVRTGEKLEIGDVYAAASAPSGLEGNLLGFESFHDGFPAKPADDPEPFFTLPNVVELGRSYSSGKTWSSQTRVENPKDLPEVLRFVTRATYDASLRRVFLVDRIERFGEEILALVVVTEKTVQTDDDVTTLHFRDGTFFTSELEPETIVSTSIEWRLKGGGMVSKEIIAGGHLDAIVDNFIFDVEPSETKRIVDPYDHLVSRQVLMGRNEMVNSNTFSPEGESADVEIVDAMVSLFGFDEVVLSPDRPPVIDGVQSLTVGSPEEIRLELSARDPDPRQQAIRFKIERGPELGETIDPFSGQLTWDVTEETPDGRYEIVVAAEEVGPYSMTSRATIVVDVRLRGSETIPDKDGVPEGGSSESESPVELTPHPADQNGDFAISIVEVTQYAEAWKSGENWPVGPNPIPIVYVTSAGTLWRNGERYSRDSAIVEAPGWWVNVE